jgi:hypothetical protein
MDTQRHKLKLISSSSLGTWLKKNKLPTTSISLMYLTSRGSHKITTMPLSTTLKIPTS